MKKLCAIFIIFVLTGVHDLPAKKPNNKLDEMSTTTHVNSYSRGKMNKQTGIRTKSKVSGYYRKK